MVRAAATKQPPRARMTRARAPAREWLQWLLVAVRFIFLFLNIFFNRNCNRVEFFEWLHVVASNPLTHRPDGAM